MARGIRITRQAKFRYEDVHEWKDGNLLSIPMGPRTHVPVPGGEYDMDAVFEGVISITPITLERTDMEVYNKLRQLNQ